MPNHARDLEGKRFGYLTVLRRIGSTRYGVLWAVRCRCGKEFESVSSDLTRRRLTGKTSKPTSCGCAQKEFRSHLYKGVGDLSSTRWLRIKKHAERKNLQFSITMKYAWELFLKQNKLCALSGVPLTMSPNDFSRGASTASLDRIDSTRGYLRGNVQWVHVIVNDLKSNMPEKEFIGWCSRIAKMSRR